MARCPWPTGSLPATTATPPPTSPPGTGWSRCWAEATFCTSRTPSCARGPRWVTSPAVAAGSSPSYPVPAPRTPPSGTGSKPTPRTGPKQPDAAGAPAGPNRATPPPPHPCPPPRGRGYPPPGGPPPPRAAPAGPPRQARIEAGIAAVKALDAKLAGPRCRYKTRAAVEHAPAAALAGAHADRWVTTAVTQTVAKTYKQARRGRPGPQTSYREIPPSRFALAADIDLEHLAHDAASDGLPLITNDTNLSDAQVLAGYRYQPNLERRHHLLKSVQD